MRHAHRSRFADSRLPLSLGLLIIYRLEGVYTFVRGRSIIEEMYGFVTATFTGIALVVFFFFFFLCRFCTDKVICLFNVWFLFLFDFFLFLLNWLCRFFFDKIQSLSFFNFGFC